MSDKKDIAKMSFEEFFSESKIEAERKETKKIEAKGTVSEQPKSKRGFLGATPKINFNNGKFLLYVPRYSGLENDRFAVAVEADDKVIPMDPLESVKQRNSRVTRPSTIDLTPANVTPMDDFIVTIDGEKAFENKAHPITFYNNIGSPVARPMGEVTAVCREGSQLKLFKCEILDSTTKNGLAIFQLMVYTSGTAKIDDNPKSEPEAEEVVEETVVEEKKPTPKAETKSEKKAAPKKTAVKGELALSQSSPDADVKYGKDRLPLYNSVPVASIVTKGCEPDECTLVIEGSEGEIKTVPASAKMYIDTKDYGGPVTVRLMKDSKKLDSVKYFIIPGFKCDYSGKGDITDDTIVKYNVFGEEGQRDMKDDDPYTFTHGDLKFKIMWCLPYVTYDIGDGMKPFEAIESNIMDLGDSITVRVRGARKKSLFFGAETGKKKELTPDWEDETVTLDLAEIRNEVLSSPSKVFSIYITVNSRSNRKFLTILNPVRMGAVYQDGFVKVNLEKSASTYTCNLYNMDKSVETVVLSEGENNVPVSDKVIEAEVVETYNGKVCNSTLVSVRPLPFLSKDMMGDKWMYVSRYKRIPLPDELFNTDGQPNNAAIKSWHERIIRMNPELKSVTFEMIQKAFKDFI